MNEHTQQKIGVVGGGLMGHGIAYLFAAAGHHVNVFEPFADVRNSLPQRLRAIVELLGDDPRLLTRIAAYDSLHSVMPGADCVFEAARRSSRKSSPPLKSWSRRRPYSPATVRQFPRPRSVGISPIATGWLARISGIRRIWCRWSKSFKTKGRAARSSSEPCNCCVGPEKCRFMFAATFRDSSATGFSTR